MGGPGGQQMGQQQMTYNNGMGYGGMNTGGPNNSMVSPQMQNMPSRFPSQVPGPGMSGPRQSLQNMLRSRTTVPGAQYGGPPQQMSAGMMRPAGVASSSGPYPGNMMPAGQSMGSMNRPMYSGGGGTMMNPNYAGMQGGYAGGYGGNPGMRMSSQGHMRPSGAYMTTPMQGSMGMSGMGMPRAGMMPSSGYNMHGSGNPHQGSYPMQGSMGMSGMSSRPGMMPPGMRMGGPGMMSQMGPGGSTGMMQGQAGMMQGQGGMMHSGGMGMQQQGQSQLMAHLQRGGGMQGQQGGMSGYQGNRY